MVLQSHEVTLASHTWVVAPAWAAHNNLPQTGKVLCSSHSAWSEDLWLLTLQSLLLLAYTSGSTHHSQGKSRGLEKQSGNLCLCPLALPM